MLKTLRKYNKWVMVVFGTILMVSFLFTGAAGQFAPDPRKEVVATAGGQKIRRSAFDLAERETEVLQQLVPRTIILDYGIQDGTHWLLLTREAEKLGLVGDERDGLDWIADLSRREAYSTLVAQYAEQFGVQFAQQIAASQGAQVEQMATQRQIFIESRKDEFAARTGLTPYEFALALSRLRGVDRLLNLYGRGPRQSDRRYIAAARRLQDSAVVDAAIIAAESIADTMPEPTPEAVQAHFEKYRAAEAGTGDFGFGYVLPPRFKLEWVLLSKSSVENAVTLDPVAVNKHWQLNRPKYAGDFATEQANVERDLRNTKVTSAMDEADRVFKSRVRAVTARLPVDGIYRRLPETWNLDAPKLQDLALSMAEAVKTSSGMTVPPPMVSRPITEWTSLPELANLGGISGASIRIGSGSMTFAELAALAKEIKPQAAIDVQARVPFTTFTLEDTVGNRYYFVMNDVKPEAPAESIDDVRDKVVKDVRTLAAYEKLVAEKEIWVNRAVTDGLAAVASSFRQGGTAPGAEPLPLEVTKDISVRRDGTQNLTLNDDDVRSRIIITAELLGPLFVASPENAQARTLAEPLPRFLSLAVVQIQRKELLAREDLLRLPPSASSQLVQREIAEVTEAIKGDGPFSPPELRKRLDFKMKGDEKKEKSEKAEGEGANTTGPV